MVTCAACGTRQAGTPSCLVCGAPVSDAVIRVDGHIPFVIDEKEVRTLLGGPWRWARKPILTRCWLRTERWDVRLDAAWEANVALRDTWELRAGWVDRWFDEVVAPPRGFDGFAGSAKRGLGHPVALPMLCPDTEPAPWKDALAEALKRALPCHRVGDLWVDDEPLEVKKHVVLVPLWRITVGDRVLWMSGETGALIGEPTGNRRRAVSWSLTLGALGLIALGMSAVIAFPGILLWPLLLVTALGALAGFGLLVAAGLPFAWVRAAVHRTGEAR